MKYDTFGPLAYLGDGPLDPPEAPECVCPGAACCECFGVEALCGCGASF